MSNSSTEKEFGLSSWAIDNKMTIYVMIGIFLIMGTLAYFGMPREDFPEVKETKIYVSTVYPGNTAEDVEKLITNPLEEELKNLTGVTDITSTSQEDYSIIIVEFDESVEVAAAKQRVKDEVDTEKASEDWPTSNGAKVEPNVFDLNLSEEVAIMNINLSGDYPVDKLKEFGEYLQDEIETLPEIKEVSIRGAQEKEVEVAVDIYKMMAAQVSFDDVINSIKGGNLTMSAGSLINQGQRRIIRIIGEIEEPSDLDNFVVKTQNGAVYLKDIANVTFREEDKTTYARELGSAVVMLDVKKRAGKNMVNAAEKINEILKETTENVFPPDLKITKTNDSSERTINQVDDLVNNIIFGIILVVTVLMFFLGFRNALFVGFAIPMSMFMSFMILEAMGYTLNTMILFGLIMGLGMLVDNGIVVVENVYRLMDEEGMSRTKASKIGIGEIAVPIIISTATTVAAFVPLGLWPGMMGEFMKYFPITLSVVLGSSLFVAIFINSMLVSEFMKVEEDKFSIKQLIVLSIVLGVPGILIMIFGGSMAGLGTLMIFTAIMFWAHQFLLVKMASVFQHRILTAWENLYEKAIRFYLKGSMPVITVIGMIVLFVVSIGLFGWSIGSQRTEIQFFPENKPNQVIVYIEYPQGTDIEKTNKITKEVENRVFGIVEHKQYIDKETGENFMVESVVSQVGEGAGNPQTDGGSAAEMPHKGKVTVSLREFKYRRGNDSQELLDKVKDTLKNIYPGVIVSVEKDAVGPPAGYPVNIEISGEDYDELISVAEGMRDYINSKNVAGVDELKIDVNKDKPAMVVDIDRKKAGELGVSAAMIGNQLRRSLYGEKAGVYKENGEDYDIYVRFNDENRYDMNALFNQNITFRDAASGQIKQVPLSSVVKYRNTASFSAIKHDMNVRVVTVYSVLASGYTDAGAVVANIQKEMANYDVPDGIKFDYTGQIEEQNKQMQFLMTALFVGLGLIFLILVFQFSSISKPTIIMVAVFLSFIGVFLGLIVTGWAFVIMMTMMGIISLAGIVVNNGVVLLDYTQILIDRKKEELGTEKDAFLPKEYVFDAIVQGGKARLRPVLLTAITTVLGLIPLAIGLNIDFFSLFSDFDPKIYMGGDNVIFWGPLAWTVIFGLIFATFLTLIVVPVLFYLSLRVKYRIMKNRRYVPENA
ncbi:Multidrug efflux pump subunit AcrB [Pustulibacterium marinum]|uniref:Multidrug efflux pump subunit AcrB n=1 Tax=Pustulibacterium marinum TaxID=1224947 RepID=A0A1I7I661_9FLAO|nr:efflux RND transporter permease subunit [Pustulibacterium marinum]SFU68418.1 Multidrug efflux pump subunit AcrB [Pustulibacterium marinum]